MHKKIEDMAAGICGPVMLPLQIVPKTLEFEVVEGEAYHGEFYLESPGGTEAEGIVCSSDPRMACHSPQFCGEKITQAFTFHSEGLSEGDVQKGNFHIISSLGEYDLPFCVTVSKDYADSSVGKIRTVFEFANLARNSYEEAVKVFGKPEFQLIFKPQETEERMIYQALMRRPCTMAQVEEFLIATKKKKRVRFAIEEACREFSGIREMQKQLITLKRDGWGFLAIEAKSDAEWIQLGKRMVTTGEFVGSHAVAEYMIDPKKLHGGKNFGRITFQTPFQKECVEICVVQKRPDSTRTGCETRRKKLEVMKAFLDMGTHKITAGAWAKATGQLLDELHLLEPDNLWYLLGKAQVFLVSKQKQEAEWTLSSFPKYKVNKESALYAYYMYLCTLQDPEVSYVNKVTGKIRRIYQKDQENNFLFWMLLFLDEEINHSRSRKLELIAQQLGRGKESAVLYLEAYRILQKDPYLLSGAGPFQRKVLYWAAKRQVLSKEIARQACQLEPEIAEYHPIWVKILAACYEVYPEREMLQAICSYCMRWNCYGERYFKWYQRGVEEELRVAGIYEAWVQSAKDMGRLPKNLVMYFQYGNGLPYRAQARLYGAMIENQIYWKGIYQHYRKNMEDFVLQKIRAGRMDRYLAPICREVLKPEMIRGELADCLAKVLFTHRVASSNPNAVYAVVRHDTLKKEQVAALSHGQGYVGLYGSDYQILLEDGRGNRFLPEEGLVVEPLMDMDKFLGKAIEGAKDKIFPLLKYFDGKRIWQTYEKEDLPYLQMLVESEEISEEYRNVLQPQMLAYYYENYTGEALDEFLLSLAFEGVNRPSRKKVMELLVARRHYNRAYELLMAYGCEHIAPSKLVYVVCHRMEDAGAQDAGPDPFLLEMCRAVFHRGKYNERILSYMCRYLKGSLDEMAQLWKAARDFGLDTYGLEERCLEQFLFTGNFLADMEGIFQSYVEKQGKEVLEIAYLTQMSHQFVARDVLVAEYNFQRIFKFLKEGQPLNGACRLGFLKWCSFQRELSQEEEGWAERLLEGCISQGIWFSFYQGLPERFAGKYLYHDKVVLEYRASPDAEVVVSYLPSQGEEYVECEMKQAYEGVFTKEFLVFYGELVPYFIKERTGGEWELTESGHIQNQEFCTSAEGSRYDLLNDMMVSRQVKDEATLWERLRTYGRLDGFVKDTFGII